MKNPIIYVIDSSTAITGAFNCARNMARALSGRARVILVIPLDSILTSVDTSDFFAVYRMPIVPLRRNFWSILFYFPALISASIILRFKLHFDRAPILVVNDFHMMHGVICRLLGFKGRLFTWVRISPSAFGKFVSWMWLKASARMSDNMIAVSKYIQSETKKISSLLLYDCVDLMSNSINQSIDTRFVFVGNYIPGKGQDRAIEAFAQIVCDFPRISLYFYGSDMGLEKNSAYLARLKSRANGLSLNNCIHFNNFIPATDIFSQGSLAALNFSKSESFSMAVLEAQGAGLPVIATRSGGPEEIIVDGETGILVPVEDIDAMAAAMRSLLDDPAYASSMGMAARERVRTHFSFERYQIEVLKLFSLV